MASISRIASSCAAVAVASLAVTVAQATPVFDTFGPLNGATFGGQGIPNQEVAVSKQIVNGDVTITLVMSATQRYSNPALTNDGVGTYFAGPGSNFGGAGQSVTEGALWNFNYYMKVEGTNGATPILADYQIDLYYDFDTGLDTPLGSLGSINVTNAILGSVTPATTLVEDSQNLNFGFLAAAIPFVVSPPAGAFDPNALGEYNFALTISSAGLPLETVAMDVQVVPEPASLALGMIGGALMISRRR